MLAVIPFLGFLLSLVLVPRRYETLSYLVFGFLGFMLIPTWSPLTEMLWGAYLPFMGIMINFYIIAHRLTLHILFKATSFNLMIFLAFGALISNLLGTTGASFVLIYPLITLLKQKQYKTHVFIFFIMLVSNCGGCLTPLGDSPLFMGYLKGVPFFWFFTHLFKPWAFTMTALLSIFYLLDSFYYKEEIKPQAFEWSLKGYSYIGILLIVIISSFIQDPFLQLSLLCFLIGLNYSYKKINWAPIVEAAQIFLVFFITLIPFEKAITMPMNLSPLGVFWFCGSLSTCLDNAPAYLLFFPVVKHSLAALKALSFSSVCMGALSYVGNAPNFMVKSIAEAEGIVMPSFARYSLYTFTILGPILLIVSLWLI